MADFSIYDSSISSSVIDIFTNIYITYHVGCDYFIARVGQYQYVMFVGDDVTFNERTLTLTNGRIYEYNAYSSYNDVPSLVSTDISSHTYTLNNISLYLYYCRTNVNNAIGVTAITNCNLNQNYNDALCTLSYSLLLVLIGVLLSRFIQRLFQKGDLHD